MQLKRVNKLLLWTTIIPTLLSILYYGFVASDVYVSESQYVIRSPQKETQAGLVGALLQNTGFSNSLSDTYSVNEYLMSRDALRELNKGDYYASVHSQKLIDFLSRFPSFDFDRSFEGLFRYYTNHVDVALDSTTSITSLTVNSFSAHDSQKINELLLEEGEKLVNRMNNRARQDVLRASEADVLRAEDRVKRASAALLAYRRSDGVFDPDKEATMQLQQAATIQDALITTQTQLAQLEALSPQNPQVSLLKRRIQTLQGQLASATGAVVGANSSYASKAPVYQQLILEQEFAEKQLGASMTSLETARTAAQRQELYLERISGPSLPDEAVLPKRIRGILTVLIVGLVLCGSLSLLVSAIREHRD